MQRFNGKEWKDLPGLNLPQFSKIVQMPDETIILLGGKSSTSEYLNNVKKIKVGRNGII